MTVVGYPLVNELGARPSVGFGNVASTVGIRGDPAQMQISVPIQRGASGGPVRVFLEAQRIQYADSNESAARRW